MVVFPSLCIRLAAPDDPVPQTEEHILLAPQVGVPSLIDDPEFITWRGGASMYVGVFQFSTLFFLFSYLLCFCSNIGFLSPFFMESSSVSTSCLVMRFLSSVDLPCHPWMAMVILPLILLLVPPTAAQTWPSCGESGNYKSNSTYEANLGLLSSTLPKKAASSTILFATDMVGNVPNTIFALAFCRGDSNASACEGCLVTAFQDGQEHWANNKDATVYYNSNPCMLRFSNQDFVATTVNDKILVIVSFEMLMNISTRADSFRLLLFTLLNNTAQSAVNSSRRFTTSRLDVSSFPTLYCLMQCTPDLTADDCAACFQPYFQLTLKYMDGRKGGRVLGTRYSMRYEIYPFFQGDPMLRIINLVSEVPAFNNTLLPVTVYPPPQSQPQSPVAAAPPPEAQATIQELHGM